MSKFWTTAEKNVGKAKIPKLTPNLAYMANLTILKRTAVQTYLLNSLLCVN